MKQVDALGHVVFTHISGGKTRCWSITVLLELIKVASEEDVIEVTAFVDPEWAEWCKHNRGVEQHRLDRLTDADLKYPVVGMMVEDKDSPDGMTYLMVDGHHRYVYAAMKKKPTINCLILSPRLMKQAEIEDPIDIDLDVLLKSYSGL